MKITYRMGICPVFNQSKYVLVYALFCAGIKENKNGYHRERNNQEIEKIQWIANINKK